MKPCKLYQFEDKETGLVVLITSNPKEIEKYFNMSLDELNRDLQKNKMIKDRFTMSIMFID